MSIAVHGEALIDFIVGDDGAYRPHLGGSPYNVAIALARQGMDVTYLSTLSDDCFGDRLLASLQGEGVRVPVRRRSLWPTSLALVTVDANGQPTYRLYREGIADKDTTFDEIIDNLPDDVQLFHTGSLALTPSQLPMIRKLFAYLRERDIVISMDMNIRLRASVDTKAYLEGVRSLWPLADIVKASDEDLGPFGLGATVRESARRVYDEMGAGMVVVTEGEGGAILHTAGGVVKRKGYPVAHVEDTVGAGDTFHAALLASLSRSGAIRRPYRNAPARKLGDAVDFACAAAGINVSRAGCSPPTREEVEALLKQGLI